jgi:hypothetical protein
MLKAMKHDAIKVKCSNQGSLLMWEESPEHSAIKSGKGNQHTTMKKN